MGFYLGSYFANKYNASAYNGYGFDMDGNQNTFVNSNIYQNIKNVYGGGFGQTDQIAVALGVDPQRWDFSESDMPTNMRYTPAIMLGFNFKVPVNPKSSILLNVNGSVLNIQGNFTITKLMAQTQPVNPASNPNIVVCPIYGKEQRMQFELGFQHLFGDDENFNFLLEAGLLGTLAKFDGSWIYINNLRIDLPYYSAIYSYTSGLYTSSATKVPVGFGIGAFTGMGINMNLNPKFNMQILYNLSQEKVNLGVNPKLKFQNALGLRVYYNL